MTRNDSLAFLTCVLPADGYSCAVIFNSNSPRPGIDKPRHVFCETIEQLTETILANDKIGRTVYHACASFREPSRRTQANALGAASFWLDVDAGPGKAYPDAEAAARAALSFCDRRQLPRPVLVGSGNGVHCYWPLERRLEPDEWFQYANTLKSVCGAEGLKADPSRTADIASILRPPGTYNRKDGERLVQFDFQSLVRYPIKAFEHLTGSTPKRDRRPVKLPGGSIASRILSGSTYGTVCADTIADQCAQLDAFRASGNLPEPQWYAAIGVLARCEDGDLKAH